VKKANESIKQPNTFQSNSLKIAQGQKNDLSNNDKLNNSISNIKQTLTLVNKNKNLK